MTCALTQDSVFEDKYVHKLVCSRPKRGLLLLLVTGLMVSALCAGCGVDVVGDEPPLQTLYNPVGMTLHPTGKYLYVVNSNFNLDYREDRGGTVVVIDTDTLEIVPGGTVQIGTFGGDIKLNTPSDGEPTRAYVAVRGNGSVTAIDLTENGAKLRCKGGTLTEDCQIPTEREDPFGVAVASFDVNIDGADTTVDFVAVAHLLGGDLTGLTIPGDQIEGFDRSAASLVAGANDIARSPRNGQFYVTSRFENAVVAFRPVLGPDGELAGVFETATVPISSAPPLSGLDSRGIAFNGDGTMAFVANRGPDSLLFLDAGPTNAETGSGTRNEIVDVLPMPSQPSEIAVVNVGERELIYVSSFADESLTIVDPQARAIIGTIDLIAEPYDLVVDQGRHKRLYATLFNQDAIAVIDIDETSPSFNQMTAVIR